MTINTVDDTAALQWQRVGKYHSFATNGPYTVAGFKLGDEIRYRASRQRNFIGAVYDSPDEAKQVCQNNFLILGQAAEDQEKHNRPINNRERITQCLKFAPTTATCNNKPPYA